MPGKGRVRGRAAVGEVPVNGAALGCKSLGARPGSGRKVRVGGLSVQVRVDPRAVPRGDIHRLRRDISRKRFRELGRALPPRRSAEGHYFSSLW